MAPDYKAEKGSRARADAPIVVAQSEMNELLIDATGQLLICAQRIAMCTTHRNRLSSFLLPLSAERCKSFLTRFTDDFSLETQPFKYIEQLVSWHTPRAALRAV